MIAGFGTYIGIMSVMVPDTVGEITTTTTTDTTTTPTTTTSPTRFLRDINPDVFTYEGVELMWIILGGFKMKFDETVVYIDPYFVDYIDESVIEPADYIVVTHAHDPHYSMSDISLLSDNDTIIISSRIPAINLHPDHTVFPGESLDFSDVSFEFVPAYNVDKYRPGTTTLFHPPSFDDIGVIVEFNGTRIYHAGDTDRIPEMMSISTDIALLPVSGYAWMEADEAADAVEDLKLSSDLAYAIPIHWGWNQGSRLDAEEFVALANCTTMILEKLFERY